MQFLDNQNAWADELRVNRAADNDHPLILESLPPRLWEALRIEMQRRLRRATGEPDAVVTFSFGESAIRSREAGE